ncbi:MAG TPA: hypothetical protein VKX17_28550 [Planctomycetota bacterium]|nr:hypothetical protein [Planctomycetota bacterium]
MKTSAVKKFWWVVFAVSAGQIVNHIASAIMLHNRLDSYFSAWTIGVAIAALILLPLAIFRLRAAYRREPPNWTGKWHLSILDFYAVALFAAVIMSLWYLAGRNTFIRVGIRQSMLLSIGFLVCLLFAARMGCGALLLRIHYALALALAFYGTMTIGAILINFASVFALFASMSLFGPLSDRLWSALSAVLAECWWIVGGGDRVGIAMPAWSLLAIRLALLSLPVGLLLLHWAKKRLARVQAEAVAP